MHYYEENAVILCTNCCNSYNCCKDSLAEEEKLTFCMYWLAMFGRLASSLTLLYIENLSSKDSEFSTMQFDNKVSSDACACRKFVLATILFLCYLYM